MLFRSPPRSCDCNSISWRPMIEVDTVLMRVQPSQQRDQRRTTDAAGHITVSESRRAGGKSVEVWRMDAFIAHEAKVRPGVIISNDVNDVGAFGCAWGNRCVISVQCSRRREQQSRQKCHYLFTQKSVFTIYHCAAFSFGKSAPTR